MTGREFLCSSDDEQLAAFLGLVNNERNTKQNITEDLIADTERWLEWLKHEVKK